MLVSKAIHRGISARAMQIALWAVVCAFQLQNAGAQEQNVPYNYVLNTGDIISISVYDEDDLSFERVTISESRVINYPFLGQLMLTGLTVAELEESIRKGLVDGEYLIRPEVTVAIVQYRSFYVDGEVNRPGGYPYEPGLTLRKAVTLAGGFTERGSRTRITIISEGDNDNEDRDITLETSVKPGDVITVAQRFF